MVIFILKNFKNCNKGQSMIKKNWIRLLQGVYKQEKQFLAFEILPHN